MCIVGLLIAGVVLVSAQQSEVPAHAKKKSDNRFKPCYTVGINGIYEVGFVPSSAAQVATFNPSISFEAQITRHSGVEVDFGYRNQIVTDTPEESGANYRFLTIPILYKYYSNVVNFAVGVNYDIEVANTRIDGQECKRHYFGFVARVTKDIQLYKGLLLEPYIQINPSTNISFGVGVGVGVKYKFGQK